MLEQLFTGSLVIGLCAAVQIGVVVQVLVWLETHMRVRAVYGHRLQMALILALAFSAVILAHTVQVWLWAISLVARGALASMDEALYFAIASYTTLGFGDIILSEGQRVFGSMAAVSGLLNFGLSTAFLLSVINEMVAPARKSRSQER